MSGAKSIPIAAFHRRELLKRKTVDVRLPLGMNMHEPLASGPPSVTRGAQSGVEGFMCEAGGAGRAVY